ncbi:hypothetical protein JG688_00012252 [Phytophthora aleatoria]|uniref:Uncharacterized protein n=1 Tax=Phytophthora aleatoria TaxID=2496075 RepID=A0A8J5IFK3_9STRA|nr:hypothetical protein JG688_00012252 [Phytophthora aleatoria]
MKTSLHSGRRKRKRSCCCGTQKMVQSQFPLKRSTKRDLGSMSSCRQQHGPFQQLTSSSEASATFPLAFRQHDPSINMSMCSLRPFATRMCADVYPHVHEDLVWFCAVLTYEQRFNSIPIELFARLQSPTHHVMMDASDTGICALEPQLRQFIRLQLTQDVRDGFAVSRKTTRPMCRSSLMQFSRSLTGAHHGLRQGGTVPMSACG